MRCTFNRTWKASNLQMMSVIALNKIIELMKCIAAILQSNFFYCYDYTFIQAKTIKILTTLIPSCGVNITN